MEWLVFASEKAIIAIDALALIVIVVGTIDSFVRAVPLIFSATGHRRREVWLRYARWLIAGLSFQLAADIIETSITTSWQTVGRLAAIAVIRTFLNYFLERDVSEAREREHEAAENA